MIKRRLVCGSLLLLVLAACHSKKRYPEPLPGWHNDDYSVIFGRLQRVVSKNPDEQPVWVIRFGLATEKYGGELALTPPQRLVGYTGGEDVELHGAVRTDLAYPSYPGNWYEIHSIRMWKPHQ
ncbi:MAG TPA: hypothetical protein VM008_17155 [Phycisphaerae bacterium]|nr:hypothetical protein [Phycisphaerae bacterium]